MKLIIHIGPPKTGTTSIQSALAGDLPDNIAFLGAFQPRTLNGPTLCSELNDYSRGGLHIGDDRLIQFREKLDANMRAGMISVVVEEVLLDSSQKIPWDQKLKNLHGFVAPYNPVISIALRHPLQGIPSLHKEFYPALGRLQRRSILLFSRSHQCQVFNYRYLLKESAEAGFEKVNLVSFDDITTRGLDLSELVAAPLKDAGRIRLENLNAKPSVRPNTKWRDALLGRSAATWVRDCKVLFGMVKARKDVREFDVSQLLAALDS